MAYNNYYQGQNKGGGYNNFIQEISAPYNFVPVTNKVFFPEWSKNISQDVPFQDGLSGFIECEMETVSEIYVRNGGNWDENKNNNKDYICFFTAGGEYIIPGTSIKGVLRSVLEIASFGKIGGYEKKTAEGSFRTDYARYSIRDLTDKKHYVEEILKNGGVKAGWLVKDKEGIVIKPCTLERIHFDELKELSKYRVDFSRFGSAASKYKEWDKQKLSRNYNGGTLVFTGKASKKTKEFVFYDKDDKSIPVEPIMMQDFEFIHSDANGTPNEEWGYWKPKFKKGEEVPIFYHVNSNGILRSFGLAMMFKLAYNHTTHDAIKHVGKYHFSPELDLADCIFGYTGYGEDLKKDLKGRVAISHAEVTGAAPVADDVSAILGSPKPTYYPNYLVQPNDKNKRYSTYMESDCKIRGWKRYPSRMKLAKPHIPNSVKNNQKVLTRFVPLSKGTKFKFTIRFHNLTKIELGALYWVLTLGGNPKLCHKIGMGKALGYGDVRLKPIQSKIWNCVRKEQENTILSKCNTSFEDRMNKEVTGWKNCDSIRQLLGMADPNRQPSTQEAKLKTMDLEKKEFINAKKASLRLEPYI